MDCVKLLGSKDAPAKLQVRAVGGPAAGTFLAKTFSNSPSCLLLLPSLYGTACFLGLGFLAEKDEFWCMAKSGPSAVILPPTGVCEGLIAQQWIPNGTSCAALIGHAVASKSSDYTFCGSDGKLYDSRGSFLLGDKCNDASPVAGICDLENARCAACEPTPPRSVADYGCPAHQVHARDVPLGRACHHRYITRWRERWRGDFCAVHVN